MMSANDTTLGSVALLDKWHGQLVPWSYEGGFIALSFVVSLIGAATTLELIQRRTAQTGKLNNVLLVGAAISMGGVAIWSMVSCEQQPPRIFPTLKIRLIVTYLLLEISTMSVTDQSS